jgi:hypothetical protein
VEHVIGRFIGELRLNFPPDAEFRDSLREFIGHYIDTLHKHTHFTRFLTWELERKGTTAGAFCGKTGRQRRGVCSVLSGLHAGD